MSHPSECMCKQFPPQAPKLGLVLQQLLQSFLTYSNFVEGLIVLACRVPENRCSFLVVVVCMARPSPIPSHSTQLTGRGDFEREAGLCDPRPEWPHRVLIYLYESS